MAVIKVAGGQVQIAAGRQGERADGEHGAEVLHRDMPPQQAGLAPVIGVALHFIEVHPWGECGTVHSMDREEAR